MKFTAHLFGKLSDFAGWCTSAGPWLLGKIADRFNALSLGSFSAPTFIKNLFGSLFGGKALGGLGEINVSNLTANLRRAGKGNWAGLGGVKDSGVNLVKGLYDNGAAERIDL